MAKRGRKQRTFKVAVVQHAPVFLDLAESLKKAVQLIEQAADQGACLVAFPESWLPGYPVWLDLAPDAALWDHSPAKGIYRVLCENSLVVPSPQLHKLRQTARRTGIYLVMGAHERVGGTLYNTMIFCSRNGREFRLHRKLMPTYSERMIWGMGDGSTLSVLDTTIGQVGGLICWEHWMPLARAALHARGEAIHVAQWPAVREMHQIASRHYAFEGQCFVLAAGCVLTRGQVLAAGREKQRAVQINELLNKIPGRDDDLLLNGGSAIIAPSGKYLAGPVYDKTTILQAELDLELIVEGRLFLDVQGHYSRPDVFRLTVNDARQNHVAFSSDLATEQGDRPLSKKRSQGR